jgi:hypothetical protein
VAGGLIDKGGEDDGLTESDDAGIDSGLLEIQEFSRRYRVKYKYIWLQGKRKI